jgi:hypothetical protein
MRFQGSGSLAQPLLQLAIRTRQRGSLVEYLENRSRRAAVRLRKRAIAAAHSPRRYLYIEAEFVFGGLLDHLSAASGQAKRRTRNIHNRRLKGIQT